MSGEKKEMPITTPQGHQLPAFEAPVERGEYRLLREAWNNGKEIVVLGFPGEETDEDNPTHNCDEMACSSVCHVIYRFNLDEATARTSGGLLEVLTELVSLKDLKDELDSRLNGADERYQDYITRKAAAWQKARELVRGTGQW